jgi:hypothetical protein
MIAQIVVYVSDPVEEGQTRLIKKFQEVGFSPLVDSIHYWKSWFVQNYNKVEHKAFYVDPWLMYGNIQDVDFEINGKPHFVVYYTEGEVDWDLVYNYFNWLLFDKEFDKQEEAKKYLELPTNNTPLNKLPIIEEDELVIKREMKDNYYKYETKEFQDMVLYSIKKPYVDLPFTVVIRKDEGVKWLFTDLYNSQDWGNYYADHIFLQRLWKEVGLDGEFTEQKLNELLKERVEQFLPQDGIVRAEPQVYRAGINYVIEKSPLFGKKFPSE